MSSPRLLPARRVSVASWGAEYGADGGGCREAGGRRGGRGGQPVEQESTLPTFRVLLFSNLLLQVFELLLRHLPAGGFNVVGLQGGVDGVVLKGHPSTPSLACCNASAGEVTYTGGGHRRRGGGVGHVEQLRFATLRPAKKHI